MKKKWREFLNKSRYWLLKKIVLDSEKYLLNQAIEDRIFYLKKFKYTYGRAFDYDNIDKDTSELKQLKSLFSTEEYK